MYMCPFFNAKMVDSGGELSSYVNKNINSNTSFILNKTCSLTLYFTYAYNAEIKC